MPPRLGRRLFISSDCRSPGETVSGHQCERPPCHITLLVSGTRWAVGRRGGCIATLLSGELNLTGRLSLQMLRRLRPTFAFLAHGRLRPPSRQNRNRCDPERQTEAAVMNEARGPPRTSAVTTTRDFALDLLLGLWHRPRKKGINRVSLLLLRHSDPTVTVLRRYPVLTHRSSEPPR